MYRQLPFDLATPAPVVNDGIGFSLDNPAIKGAEIYVGTAATLVFTLTNKTGGDIGWQAGAAAPSTLEVFMPVPDMFDAAAVQAMQMGQPLDDWKLTYESTDVSLLLTYTGDGHQPWADGATLQFQISNVKSTASPTAGSVAINFNNLKGSVPPSVQQNLTLAKAPQPGNAKLTDVLEVTLDNQGSILVSERNDPLLNTLLLNIKNKGDTALYTGPGVLTPAPTITVTFVYGSTSGALAPDNKQDAPLVGSAWKISAGVRFPQGNDWNPQDPSPTGPYTHPKWILQPANNNQQLIGTGAKANITFSFSQIVSQTPPGHTQMTLLFSGFKKDEHTKYDDAVYVLDIVKQSPPPTRGLLNFFSITPRYVVTQPDQSIQIPVRWTMFDVARVSLIASYPGISPQDISYPNPAPIAYDNREITIPGTVNSTGITLSLQAYDGNGGFLNSLQFTAYIEARMFVDPRDGKVYPLLQVGNRQWMAANLDYDAPSGSTYYGQNADFAKPFGRLYTLTAAQYKQPEGWRLPRKDDWNELFAAFGDARQAYAALLSTGQSGFAAQLGGMVDNNNNFSSMDNFGFYWTSTPNPQQPGQNLYAGFSGNSQEVSTVGFFSPGFGLSVRYVRDVS